MGGVKVVKNSVFFTTSHPWCQGVYIGVDVHEQDGRCEGCGTPLF